MTSTVDDHSYTGRARLGSPILWSLKTTGTLVGGISLISVMMESTRLAGVRSYTRLRRHKELRSLQSASG